MAIGLFVLIGLVAFGLWVWGLVDALAKPDAVWQSAGQNKILWVVVIVLAGVIGAVIYLVVARPQLERAAGGV